MEENIVSNKKFRFAKILISIILISILPIYYLYSTYFINNEIIPDSNEKEINIFNKCRINISSDWKISDEIQEKYIIVNSENLDGHIYCEDYKVKNIFESVSLNTNENILIQDGWTKTKEQNSSKIINLRILKIKEKQYKDSNDKNIVKVTYVYPVDREFNLILSFKYYDINKYYEDKKYIINAISSLSIIRENENQNIGLSPIKKENYEMCVILEKYNINVELSYMDKYENIDGRTPESMRFKPIDTKDKTIANVSLIAMEKYDYFRTIVEKYEMNSEIEYIKDIDVYKEKTFENSNNKFSYIIIKYIDKIDKKKKESVYVVNEIRPTMLYAIEIINEGRNTGIEKIKEFTNIEISK